MVKIDRGLGKSRRWLTRIVVVSVGYPLYISAGILRCSRVGAWLRGRREKNCAVWRIIYIVPRGIVAELPLAASVPVMS